jgi:CHAD domain-containing protein
VDETERAELMAALHQAATFAEALLDLNTRLLDALTTGENRPDSEELDYLRVGLSRWREQISTLRQRIAGLTGEPPQRMQ